MLLSCVDYVFVTLLLFKIVAVESKDLLAVTSAKRETDGLRRLLRSAKIFDLEMKIIGQEKSLECDSKEEHCRQEDIGKTTLLPLRNMLKGLQDNKDRLVIVTQSDTSLFNSGEEVITAKFRKFEAQVVFSADTVVDLEEELKSQFPEIENGKRFLNSAGIIGYASSLYKLLNEQLMDHTGDDDLFFTKIYLNSDLREKYQIKIDHKSKLLQTLSEEDEIDIKHTEDTYLFNKHSRSIPSIMIGSERNPTLIDVVGDHLAKSFNPTNGCLQCLENNIILRRRYEEDYPVVLIGIIIFKPTPFFDDFLTFFYNLNYPKSKIRLFIHLGNEFNKKEIEGYLNKFRRRYLSIKYDGVRENIEEWQAKQEAIELCIEKKCDYYFNLDSTVHLMSKNVLGHLIEQNRTVVAPIISYYDMERARSNAWRFTTKDGIEEIIYRQSSSKADKERGLWTMPYISSVYLINGTVLRSRENDVSFYRSDLEADVTLCQYLRKSDVLLYASNRFDYGYFLSGDDFNTTHLRNDIYNIPQNVHPWQLRYVSSDYAHFVGNNKDADQLCPGVYRFPFLTDRFCKELIEIMEHNGKWISDKTEEEGMVASPNHTIFLNDADFSVEWFKAFAQFWNYFRKKIYPQYESHTELSYPLVARYTPNVIINMKELEDDSTYTLSIDLNKQGSEFEGGGVYFFKDDCMVTDLKQGWVLVYRSELGSEVLKTTSGVRHVLVLHQSIWGE